MSAYNGRSEVTVKIWVVEDDSVVAQLVSDLLLVEGYEVTRYSDGREPIELLQRGEFPNAMVLDLIMPVADGNDVLDVVARLGKPPVILLTAYLDSIRESVIKVPSAVVLKPFNYRQLMSVIAHVAGKKN